MIKTLKLSGVGSRMPLILGLGFGLLAAALAFVYLSNQSSDGGGVSGVAAEPVVVAAQDIPAGATITSEMVTVKDIAISSVIPEVFRETDNVVGQVTTVQIVAGEQVLPTKVSTTAIDTSTIEGELPISLVIPAGMRGFAVAISEAGAAGGLAQPGDFVDLLSSEETVSATDSNVTISKSCVVVQDVRILALAQNVINTAATADQSNVQPASRRREPWRSHGHARRHARPGNDACRRTATDQRLQRQPAALGQRAALRRTRTERRTTRLRTVALNHQTTTRSEHTERHRRWDGIHE